jgi:hypothetical protein
MTTTLKSFQAEMEGISHDKHLEHIKRAKEAHAAAELAKHHGKKKEVPKEKEKEQAEAEIVEVEDIIPEATLEVRPT